MSEDQNSFRDKMVSLVQTLKEESLKPNHNKLEYIDGYNRACATVSEIIQKHLQDTVKELS